jgi:hypothetical protein
MTHKLQIVFRTYKFRIRSEMRPQLHTSSESIPCWVCVSAAPPVPHSLVQKKQRGGRFFRGRTPRRRTNADFLTDWTGCTNEMSKRTTSKKNLSEKTTSQWRHVWPGDTWHMPSGPTPAWGCRHSQRWHVAWQLTPFVAVCLCGPCRLPHFRHVDVALAANGRAGTLPSPTGPSSDDNGAGY